MFGTPEEARNFEMSVKGAETYHDPTHVFLPKPHGLELVFASKTGQTAYGKPMKDAGPRLISGSIPPKGPGC